jgi:osmotically-inducible protein OsmY
MNTLLALMAGALSMYILDPYAGRRRRVLARDQLVRLQRKAQQNALIAARDLRNRALGTLAEARGYWAGERVDDAVLAERARSKLGFLVRRPSAIRIEVSEGRVRLAGAVLADEVQQLVRGIASVRGVSEVENRLEVHETASEAPGLQGNGAKPTGQRLDLLQRRWSPATRFLVGASAACLLLALKPYRKGAALLSGMVGLGWLAYSVAEEEWARDEGEKKRAEPDLTAGWSGT